jgi:hypothetical protein
MKVSLLGQGGTLLGQQNWGTQRPQQNCPHRAMGDAVFAPKNGGLNIHNESITARAKGDAAREKNLGYSTSTTKWSPPGNGGCRVCAKKLGDPTSTPKVLPLGKRGATLGQQKGGDSHFAMNKYSYQRAVAPFIGKQKDAMLCPSKEPRLL